MTQTITYEEWINEPDRDDNLWAEFNESGACAEGQDYGAFCEERYNLYLDDLGVDGALTVKEADDAL